MNPSKWLRLASLAGNLKSLVTKPLLMRVIIISLLFALGSGTCLLVGRAGPINISSPVFRSDTFDPDVGLDWVRSNGVWDPTFLATAVAVQDDLDLAAPVWLVGGTYGGQAAMFRTTAPQSDANWTEVSIIRDIFTQAVNVIYYSAAHQLFVAGGCCTPGGPILAFSDVSGANPGESWNPATTNFGTGWSDISSISYSTQQKKWVALGRSRSTGFNSSAIAASRDGILWEEVSSFSSSAVYLSSYGIAYNIPFNRWVAVGENVLSLGNNALVATSQDGATNWAVPPTFPAGFSTLKGVASLGGLVVTVGGNPINSSTVLRSVDVAISYAAVQTPKQFREGLSVTYAASYGRWFVMGKSNSPISPQPIVYFSSDRNATEFKPSNAFVGQLSASRGLACRSEPISLLTGKVVPGSVTGELAVRVSSKIVIEDDGAVDGDLSVQGVADISAAVSVSGVFAVTGNVTLNSTRARLLVGGLLVLDSMLSTLILRDFVPSSTPSGLQTFVLLNYSRAEGEFRNVIVESAPSACVTSSGPSVQYGATSLSVTVVVSNTCDGGLKAGAIAGIVIGCVAGAVLIGIAIVVSMHLVRKSRTTQMASELRAKELDNMKVPK